MFKIVLSPKALTDPLNISSIDLGIYKILFSFPQGISFAPAIFQKNKFNEEEFMSRVFYFFKNRQVKKQVRARIEMWLVSERLKEGFPVAVSPVKN
jgi:hypothetical protein